MRPLIPPTIRLLLHSNCLQRTGNTSQKNGRAEDKKRKGQDLFKKKTTLKLQLQSEHTEKTKQTQALFLLQRKFNKNQKARLNK